MRYAASPSDELGFYLADLQQDDPATYQHYTELAEDLTANANTSFAEQPIWHPIAIPVAAARENQLERTLRVIEGEAKKAPLPPHITISANHVADTPNAALVSKNLDMIKRFAQAQTEIPVSYYHDIVAEGTPIGDIRNGLAVSPALIEQERCQQQGQPLHDMLHTTWDADILRTITPDDKGYLAYLQECFVQRSPSVEVQVMGPQVRHEQVDATRFPAAHRLLALYDIDSNVIGQLSPAAYSINLVGLARARGFTRAGIGEVAGMGMAAKSATQAGAYEQRVLADYAVEVSSRRLLGKMMLERFLDYGALNARPQEDDLSDTGLRQDVSEAYFLSQVASTAESLLEIGFSQAVSAAKKAGEIRPSQVAAIQDRARAFVLAKTVVVAGGPYDASARIQETITDADLWRRSSVLNRY